ncbi:MAG: hypothetical protein GY926_01785 [bacterium]|nr:hypothetical protein [bacterium]MCP4963945.1 hypothetical protein [bacterium]
MQIGIDHSNEAQGGLIATPVDPYPPNEFESRYRLNYFEASADEVPPFTPIEITWSIDPVGSSIDPNDLAVWLTSPHGVVHARDLPLEGCTTYRPTKTALLFLQLRTRQGRHIGTFDERRQIRTDETECIRVGIAASLVGSIAEQRIRQLDQASQMLRVRGDDAISASWDWFRVTFNIPLEVVINDFFNADLDVSLTLQIGVRHTGDTTELDVTVRHESKLDFSLAEDILSLGSSGIVAKTANHLLPLIIGCEARALERDIARQLVAVIEGRLTGRRLQDARIHPDGDPGGPRIELVLCPYGPS